MLLAITVSLEETYRKQDSNDVKGYSGLVELLTNELNDERQANTMLEELQSLVHQDQKRENETYKEEISIVKEASEAIMKKHRLLTIEESREIWYYRNGVYVPGGEILIEKEAERTYGYELANRHLSEIKGDITRRTYRTREEIDSDLNIINLKNGLYNVRTGEFKQHSPEYPTINQVPIVYSPEAKPRLFRKFLGEVLYRTELRISIELRAYILYRDNPFEIITNLFGSGLR